MVAPAYETTIRVRTFKADGRLLSRLAHDLQLCLTDFEIAFYDGKVTLVFSPSSLVVEGALVDGELAPGTLTDRHKSEIQSNIRERVLYTERHPRGRFDGSYVEASDRVRVEGSLRLLDEERFIRFALERGADGFTGRVELVPSRWGVTPYTAMLGALRVQDRVEILILVRSTESHGSG